MYVTSVNATMQSQGLGKLVKLGGKKNRKFTWHSSNLHFLFFQPPPPSFGQCRNIRAANALILVSETMQSQHCNGGRGGVEIVPRVLLKVMVTVTTSHQKGHTEVQMYTVEVHVQLNDSVLYTLKSQLFFCRHLQTFPQRVTMKDDAYKKKLND